MQFLECIMALKAEKQSRLDHEKSKVMRDMIAHKYGEERPVDKELVTEAERWMWVVIRVVG